MDNNELFKNVLKWARHHCHDLWKEYLVQSSPEKKQHLARKILIEKVKKEPDTELLISPDLKKKILLKEGVDLKRINHEYQEKKESCKEKQETKIENKEQSADGDINKERQETKIKNQVPGKDSDINYKKIIDFDLSEHFNQEWNKVNWYSVSAIASKLGIHRNTVAYWRDFGIKINEVTIRLKMAKKPNLWYAKGKWLIEFFLKINANVDME